MGRMRAGAFTFVAPGFGAMRNSGTQLEWFAG